MPNLCFHSQRQDDGSVWHVASWVHNGVIRYETKPYPTMEEARMDAERWQSEFLTRVRETLLGTGTQDFGVRFVKRTTGEVREMHCRLGDTEHLTEEPKKKGLDFRAYRLVGVFDVDKQEYRSIPIENVLAIKLPGQEEWTCIA